MKGSKRRANALHTFGLSRSLTVAAVICGAVILVAGGGTWAQTGIGSGVGTASQSGSHQSGATGSAANGSPSLLDPGPSPFPDNSRQKRNEERQRRLVSDTQKLVALTAQLKDEVAASGAEAMTPEMLKQMDEIEKLAKSVKDKMRD